MNSAEALNAEQWIRSLNLQKHPEGGWFREAYRSEETVPQLGLPSRFDGDRRFSTAIYFLLKDAEFSALHRIRQDELWHFYAGGPLSIHVLGPDAGYTEIKLGRDIQAGETPMAVVRAGYLFGAALPDPRSYALVGCTVAPGFDFDDFELPGRSRLLEQYPQHRALIEKLTRAS